MEKSIKGFDAYTISSDGVVTNTRTGRVLKQEVTYNGYARVTLSQDSTLKRFLVHRLLLETFIGLDDERKYVNHKNGVKTDNRLENLEWCTQSENQLHAYESRLQTPICKFPDEVIFKILDCLTVEKLSCRKTAKKLSVKPSLVFDINQKRCRIDTINRYFEGATTIRKE
jgi:hypothetical protein